MAMPPMRAVASQVRTHSWVLPNTNPTREPLPSPREIRSFEMRRELRSSST